MTGVRVGLGWPTPQDRPPGTRGLGWPGVDGRPTATDTSGVDVSASTAPADAPTAPFAAVTAAVTVTVTDSGPPAERSVPAPVPRETGGLTEVPPVTAQPAAERTRTPSTPTEEDTPIARAARVAVRLRSPDPADAFPRPRRTRVIVVANQKGGVGKTTSTVNLGAALALHGQRVLVIDLDPQGNASTALGVHHPAGSPSIYDVVIDGDELGSVVRDSPGVAGLVVAPATIDLAGAEIELVPMVAREARLRRAVTAHLAAHDDTTRPDYVLIDCPPSLGLLTLNALVAADEVLIPIQCEYYALEGLGQLVKTIEMVTTHLNAGLRISTILLTMYDARTRLAAQVADEVRSHFTDRVLPTAVPRSVRVSEAPSYGQTVLTYDPGSPGSMAYVEAAREMSASLRD